jgi:chemotaxis signal transduction protein
VSGAAHLVVRVGDALAALPAGGVRRVVRGVRLHGLPGSGAGLLGLAEFAGEPLAVLELAPLLGLEPAATPPPVTVVAWVGAGEERELLGLAVDDALEVADLAGEDLTSGAALVRGRPVRLVDLETLGAEP